MIGLVDVLEQPRAQRLLGHCLSHDACHVMVEARIHRFTGAKAVRPSATQTYCIHLID